MQPAQPSTETIDHDRLFKELIRTFFAEFVELFFPEIAEGIDRDSIEFLDKQIFTDVTEGERHEADLVVKARWRGHTSFFLFHVESQSNWRSVFPRRMFIYFSRLHEMHAVPVYPIAVLTYDKPFVEAPSEYRVAFPDGDVLMFRYRVVQLNRLSWRDYVERHNPVATALMAKMRIAPEDRKRVKFECLRLLLTLRLDRAKMGLIAGFVSTYLRLQPAEEAWVNEEMEPLDPGGRERSMFWTDWHEKGFQEGAEQGMQQGLEQGLEQGLQQGLQQGRRQEALGLVHRLLRRRLGPSSEAAHEQIGQLTIAQLEELTEASIDFSSFADLERWLDNSGRASRTQ